MKLILKSMAFPIIALIAGVYFKVDPFAICFGLLLSLYVEVAQNKQHTNISLSNLIGSLRAQHNINAILSERIRFLEGHEETIKDFDQDDTDTSNA